MNTAANFLFAFIFSIAFIWAWWPLAFIIFFIGCALGSELQDIRRHLHAIRLANELAMKQSR